MRRCSLEHGRRAGADWPEISVGIGHACNPAALGRFGARSHGYVETGLTCCASLGQLQWHLDDSEMVRVPVAALLGRALVPVDEAYSMLGSISERRPLAEGDRALS